MTCRRSSHQVSTEELEKRPSRPRQRQPTNQPTTTRTSHAHMQPLGPDLLLEKSNRNREQLSRLSRKAYHLQRLERPLPATTAAAAAAVASRHTPSPPTAASKVCATQVSSGSNRSSFAVDRQTLFTGRDAQRSTADCSAVDRGVAAKGATTSTRNKSTGEISP